MKLIVFLILIWLVYVGVVPIVRNVVAEQACFSSSQKEIDNAESQVKASVWPQDRYCRVTYDALDVLTSCVANAQEVLSAKIRKIIPPIVNDVEIELQNRTKSLPALKADHDEICRDYHGYRFEP